jgi:tetratricopeptide (TPR) repeat protein
MSRLQEWKDVKTAFAITTCTSKPSESAFVGKKSSGMEKACKALDKAEGGKSLATMLKAEDDYAKAMSAYDKVLVKALRNESNFDDAVEILRVAMTDILATAVVQRGVLHDTIKTQLTKAATTSYEDIAGIYAACNEDLSSAQTKVTECDGALSDVIELCAGGNNKAAETKKKKIETNHKLITTAHAKVIKTYNKADKDYVTEKAKWTKIETLLGGSSPIRAQKDNIFGILTGFSDNLIPELLEAVNGALQAKQDAASALSGSLSEEAKVDVYAASAKRLSKLAISSVQKLDSEFRDVGGGVDKAKFDRMNGEAETQKGNAAEAQELYKSARLKLTKTISAIKNLQSIIETSKKKVEKQLNGYSDEIAGHERLRDTIANVKKAIGFFDKMLEGLDGDLIKAERELDRVPD